MKKFQLQKLGIIPRIWYVPDHIDGAPYDPKVFADSVRELRRVIQEAADRSDSGLTYHYRIVTSRGRLVERWKVRPGWAKKLRRKR